MQLNLFENEKIENKIEILLSKPYSEETFKKLFWDYLEFDRIYEPLYLDDISLNVSQNFSRAYIFAEQNDFHILLFILKEDDTKIDLSISNYLASAIKSFFPYSLCLIADHQKENWAVSYLLDDGPKSFILNQSAGKQISSFFIKLINISDDLSTFDVKALFEQAFSEEKLITIINEIDKEIKALIPKPSLDSLSCFFRDLSKFALLTPEEEVRCFNKLKEAENVYGYASQEAKKIREFIACSNLRLVVFIAKQQRNRIISGLTFSDLIQEGFFGLIKAIEKFDVAKEYKFSTYATWWIRQSITRAIADKSRIVRFPVHLHEKIARINFFRNRLYQEYKREPTFYEICSQLKISNYVATLLHQKIEHPLSLDQEIGNDLKLKDLIADDAPFSHQLYEQKELKKMLYEVLDSFKLREKRVIELRYGLKDGHPRTLEEIGRVFGVTRERIRQIEAKALSKLRQLSEKRLSSYINWRWKEYVARYYR